MTTLDTSRVGLKPPPTPSKWDIIPVHTSDRGTFKQCRRKWAWSSPSRLNLVRKVQVHGVTLPLWFGTGCHYALERYYNPVLKEDPAITFESWFNRQWDGGLVHASELHTVEHQGYKAHPTLEDTYVVMGLNELLPDPDEELFLAHKELGIGMMQYYKQYAEREDNFAVIMVEHDFSVPILRPDGTQMMWMDARKVEGEENQIKPVHARGRMDIVVQDLETGQFGIFDHKTAARIDEDYFRHLDLDDQVTTYWWAAESEAQEYDLEYKKIDFAVINAIRKAFPRPPTLLKDGTPSVDRQKESTTAALFEKCIQENGLQIIYQSDSTKGISLRSYYSYLVEMGDKLFVQRDPVRRNPHEIASCGVRLYQEAHDMLNDPYIYHSPSKDYSCLNCIFRPPCKAVEAGYDFEAMIDDGYESNYDR